MVEKSCVFPHLLCGKCNSKPECVASQRIQLCYKWREKTEKRQDEKLAINYDTL